MFLRAWKLSCLELALQPSTCVVHSNAKQTLNCKSKEVTWLWSEGLGSFHYETMLGWKQSRRSAGSFASLLRYSTQDEWKAGCHIRDSTSLSGKHTFFGGQPRILSESSIDSGSSHAWKNAVRHILAGGFHKVFDNHWWAALNWSLTPS